MTIRTAIRISLIAPLAAGCAFSVEQEHIRTHSFDASDVETIVVTGDTISVEFTSTDTTEIEVEQYQNMARTRPDVSLEVRNGTLYIDSECHTFSGQCGSLFEIAAPPALNLDISGGSGTVDVYGLDGDLTVSNGSGAIDVSDITGDVQLDCGSGSVDARGLRGAEVFVETGSGGITVRHLGDLERVKLDAGSGHVELTVPTGAYKVEVDTGSGKIEVDDNIIDDPSATARIDVNTGSGGVDIFGR